MRRVLREEIAGMEMEGEEDGKEGRVRAKL
jgi:hypothetical protein